jgi:hypothetical protein
MKTYTILAYLPGSTHSVIVRDEDNVSGFLFHDGSFDPRPASVVSSAVAKYGFVALRPTVTLKEDEIWPYLATLE